MALEVDSPIIQEIREAARECKIGVSFGFFETDHGRFYSSQLTIGQTGEIIDLYRRVSPGWKEKHADEAYCEGDSFYLFEFMGEKISIGLCGDLWYDENIEKIEELKPDMVRWPVYTDFVAEEWNESIIYDYAQQAGKIEAPVLYVNSVCLDRFEEKQIAKGGAAVFQNGEAVMFTPAGEEGILLYD